MQSGCRIITKISIYFLFLSFFFSPMFAQAPDTLWTRTYGGLKAEEAYSVLETSDGGFIILGYTRSFGAGGADVYLIKTDSNGNILWTRTYGGRYNDYGRSIKKALSGEGYIIAGHTTSFGAGRHDVYLIRTDDNGDTLWTRTYGGSDWDIAYSVQPTFDGGFIVVGKTYSPLGRGMFDVYLIKTDVDGDTVWTRTYGGSGDDAGYDVLQTFDGGYIVVGSRYLFDARSFFIYLIGTNNDGDALWTNTYEGFGGEGMSITKSGSGYIITGVASLFGTNDDVLLMNISGHGDVGWVKLYGESGDDMGYSVSPTFDNEYNIDGYIVIGHRGPYWPEQGGYGVYIVRTDLEGNAIWTKTPDYGGYNDFGYSGQQTSDGGYIVVGGIECSSYEGGVSDVYLIRLASDVGILEETDTYVDKFQVKIFPNPFSNIINIKFNVGQNTEHLGLKIYDLSGRLVRDCSINQFSNSQINQITWHGIDDRGEKVPNGLYFLKLTAGDYTETRKLLLVR